MSTVIVTALPWLPVTRLHELMVDENVGAVPVVDDAGMPVGIVTRSDLLEEDGEDDAAEVTASDLMRRAPTTIAPGTPISEAARIMARQRVHHLLVVDLEGRLTGLLSTFDVVRWVADSALAVTAHP
ncbi:MAG: CBS domain-containing protein [Myxococcaceae bacterium]|nr:CBS domain-containing protein [Myxococcaceae bacterium]